MATDRGGLTNARNAQVHHFGRQGIDHLHVSGRAERSLTHAHATMTPERCECEQTNLSVRVKSTKRTVLHVADAFGTERQDADTGIGSGGAHDRDGLGHHELVGALRVQIDR